MYLFIVSICSRDVFVLFFFFFKCVFVVSGGTKQPLHLISSSEQGANLLKVEFIKVRLNTSPGPQRGLRVALDLTAGDPAPQIFHSF